MIIIICFLHQMRTGEIIWDAAYQHKWSVNSVQQDFYHVLEHFVDEFDQEVIHKKNGTWHDISILR